MAGNAFWRKDWFLGLMVSLVLLAMSRSDLIQSLERKAYDMGVQAATRVPSDKIAIIAIDDQSIANLGRWPWSRELHARMTDLLAAAPAKVIGNTVFFSEPQRDPGYDYITRLQSLLTSVTVDRTTVPEIGRMATLLDEAESALNTDRKLAASYQRAGSVVMPMLFELGQPQGLPDGSLPPYVLNNQIPLVNAAGGLVPDAVRAQVPVAVLGEQVAAVGHLNVDQDVDGAVRVEPLVIRYFDQYFPSFTLMLAARSLNLSAKDIQVRLGESVQLGRLSIPTDEATRMQSFFYRTQDGRPAFAVDSFYDVLSGKIPPSKYAGKIVLIGATAAGIGNAQVTPVAPDMPPVVTLAHFVSSILQGHFFVSPAWTGWASFAVSLLIAAYLIVLLPRLTAAKGALLTTALLGALLAAHFGLMLGAGLWIPLMSAATLLLVGHLTLTTKRFLVTERGKERSDLESAESNRMLGLAFQGQGQLDMAFDKFRKCPLDDNLMENLYNLALDYERKRQFNKAEAVFRYMADYRLDFRDLPERIARAKQLADTVLLAGGHGQTAGGTVILGDGTVEKPMLGRYQVEKELGKGAMGVVYLGRDPKINRVVAIKTMALSQEFEPDELEEVKARFFREVETAGRLAHPNIVTMYDAGEEHDLAYIAMEFLQGGDLAGHTKPGSLLPFSKALSVVARVADALDYAHQHQVVHRDIKPANIMYEPTSDTVKVTDFGIARITDASKTRTGMVLGTPSYMSPEQLSGHKVDGRSDIFSLGVTLYQLCSGQLPFVAESMAQLMFKIANEEAPDIRDVNPKVPAIVAEIIAKAMAKDISKRYQRAGELAEDLRRCLGKSARKGAS